LGSARLKRIGSLADGARDGLGPIPRSELKASEASEGKIGLEDVESVIERAREGARPVRLHVAGGEVLVVQVLAAGSGRVRCRVLTSSRPENHAHCDSTGLDLSLAEIQRAALVDPERYRDR
jgi:hypothetical protein